jgi:hypothetical protein
MLNFVEMNLPKATVSITARGLAALKATQHLRRAERLPIGSSKSLSLSPWRQDIVLRSDHCSPHPSAYTFAHTISASV